MSTLIVDELFASIQFEQEFTIDRSLNIAHIRPWIYLHGTLGDGQLQCEVIQNTTTLATSTIDYTLINAVKTETYAHGFIRFDFDSLQLNIAEGNTSETYKLRFEMINHTSDSNNFLGLVRNWDLKIYDTYGAGVVDNQAVNDSIEPVGIEIYEYQAI